MSPRQTLHTIARAEPSSRSRAAVTRKGAIATPSAPGASGLTAVPAHNPGGPLRRAQPYQRTYPPQLP